jgi:hypothetical protein
MNPDERHEDGSRWRRLVERWTGPGDEWRRSVQRWVDSGIVTRAQGDEILSLERGDAVKGRTGEVLSPSREMLSYGFLLVLAISVTLFLSHYWMSMGRGGHLSVALLVSVDALIVGATIVELAGHGARRVGGLLWLIATIGVATSVSDVIKTGTQIGPRLIIVGLATLITSVLLWRNQNRPLQFLSGVVGLTLTLCGLATVSQLHISTTQLALVLWSSGFALGLSSLRLIRPAGTALVVSIIGCSVAALSLSFPHHFAGLALGLLASVAGAALGVLAERPLVLVLGVLGFFMFDIRAFSLYLRSSNAALGAGVIGLMIVLVGLWHAARTVARKQRDDQRHATSAVDNELIASS